MSNENTDNGIVYDPDNVAEAEEYKKELDLQSLRDIIGTYVMMLLLLSSLLLSSSSSSS